jgi:glycosyltransferase involved in cell wall biosynthesis
MTPVPILVHRVIARLNTGGPAMHVVHLAEGLDPSRFETRLITGRITEDEGDMTYYARDRGVDVVEVAGMSRILSPWKDLRTLLTLFRIFRREQPTIVHTHTAKAGTVGRLAALAAGVPVIMHTFHGHVLGGRYFSPLKTRIFVEIERQLARATDRLIVLTRRQAMEMAEELGIAEPEKFSVIPLGLDLRPFAEADREEARRRLRDQLGIEEGRPVIGIVGRMVPVKNHELLFDAVEILHGRMDPGPHVVVVGSGERQHLLKRYAAEKGLDRLVHWLGWRQDLAEIYPAFDLTALTSFDEGTPVSLLESLAAGTPVVSRAVGGVPEILKDGRLGHLVWSDSAGDFADALESVLKASPEPEMVVEARETVLGRYSVERLARDMDQLYMEVLARAGYRFDE